MSDGTCTMWPDGYKGLWIDCCYQHDCDCDEVYPLPCRIQDNYYLMRCVEGSSYSQNCKYKRLVRVNAKLMFAGINTFLPILRRLGRVAEKLRKINIHGEGILLEDII